MLEKIREYIYGRLTEEEEMQLWVEFTKDEALLDDLIICLYLKRYSKEID